MGAQGRTGYAGREYRKKPSPVGTDPSGTKQSARSDQGQDRGSSDSTVMTPGGFRIAFVNWRFDTFINNLVLVITMIICTILLMQKMTTNGFQTRETMKQVGMMIEKSTESQKALVDRVTAAEAKQEKINDGVADNLDKLVKIKESLERTKLIPR